MTWILTATGWALVILAFFLGLFSIAAALVWALPSKPHRSYAGCFYWLVVAGIWFLLCALISGEL